MFCPLALSKYALRTHARLVASTPPSNRYPRQADYKPFVLTVMMAASSSFITPIGYQTNTMVWAPGGYKFSDFIKLGTPLSVLNLVVGSFLMPYVFPF